MRREKEYATLTLSSEERIEIAKLFPGFSFDAWRMYTQGMNGEELRQFYLAFYFSTETLKTKPFKKALLWSLLTIVTATDSRMWSQYVLMLQEGFKHRLVLPDNLMAAISNAWGHDGYELDCISLEDAKKVEVFMDLNCEDPYANGFDMFARLEAAAITKIEQQLLQEVDRPDKFSKMFQDSDIILACDKVLVTQSKSRDNDSKEVAQLLTLGIPLKGAIKVDKNAPSLRALLDSSVAELTLVLYSLGEHWADLVPVLQRFIFQQEMAAFVPPIWGEIVDVEIHSLSDALLGSMVTREGELLALQIRKSDWTTIRVPSEWFPCLLWSSYRPTLDGATALTFSHVHGDIDYQSIQVPSHTHVHFLIFTDQDWNMRGIVQLIGNDNFVYCPPGLRAQNIGMIPHPAWTNDFTLNPLGCLPAPNGIFRMKLGTNNVVVSPQLGITTVVYGDVVNGFDNISGNKAYIMNHSMFHLGMDKFRDWQIIAPGPAHLLRTTFDRQDHENSVYLFAAYMFEDLTIEHLRDSREQRRGKLENVQPFGARLQYFEGLSNYEQTDLKFAWFRAECYENMSSSDGSDTEDTEIDDDVDMTPKKTLYEILCDRKRIRAGQ